MAFMAIGIILVTMLRSAGLAQALAGKWWALPLLAHALLAVLLFVLYGKSSNYSTLFQKFIAWCSALLPLIIRIQWEEKIINGYAEYAKQVPSRLVPGLW